MNDIFVRTIKLPFSIRGFVIPDENGDYNIYINSRISADMQRSALRHELVHIKKGDCYSSDPVLEIEKTISN